MGTATSQLKETNLGNVEGEALEELERRWDTEGKSPAKKRWLRYYYRNRERFLAKRTEAKKTTTSRYPRTRTIADEYVEKVDIKPGLIA